MHMIAAETDHGDLYRTPCSSFGLTILLAIIQPFFMDNGLVFGLFALLAPEPISERDILQNISKNA